MENKEGPAYAFISTTSTTFHPENPLENAIIDNPGLVRRRRRKTSARELEVLEMAFKENEKPSKEIRDEIARKTGMDTKAVQIWFQNKRQSTRRVPKPTTNLSAENSVLSKVPLSVLSSQPLSHPNIPAPITSNVRIPLAVKTNLGPLSPKTKNIQKPSLETTCLSSCAPKRAPMKRTPSIRLGEGIGGKATVLFEETTVGAENIPTEAAPKRRKPSAKNGRTKKIRDEYPGKENIPPQWMPEVNVRREAAGSEPRSADLEEIALGLVALRDAR